MIPFVDLKLQYKNHRLEIDSAIQNVLDDAAFVAGRYVDIFEKEFAYYLGVKHCVACANGTDTLEILLKAYGIGHGDEVIVPAHTWISTAEAVSNVGATPVFVDTHPDTYTIDVTLIEKSISKRTKAIMPVHLYGLPADMDEVMRIANSHNLIVIEDCAQAHLATYKGKMVGTIGHAASFSFYPGKNLGAYGDAGAICTNDDKIAELARMISNHGQKERHNHVLIGRNSRMDGLNAAVLSVKLNYIDEWNDQRIANAKMYSQLLDISKVKLPVVPVDYSHVFHLYVIQVNNREKVMQALRQGGVEASIHYPHILPTVPVYLEKDAEKKYPVSFGYSSKILSLPMFAELTNEQIGAVCKIVNENT